MLSAALRGGPPKKKRSVTAPVPLSSVVDAAAAGERERAEMLARLARTRLRHYASFEDPLACFLSKPIMKVILELGTADGIGLLLKMARFGSDDAPLSDEAYQHFISECGENVDNIAAGVLNYSVIIMLLLTIFVSIATLHVGSYPYAAPLDEAPAQSWVVGDAADVFSNDPVAFRAAFYVVEYLLLAFGISTCIVGTYRSVSVYSAITAQLPSVVSKCEYLIAKPKRISNLLDHTQFGLISLATLLPCLLVRSSVFAFVCAVAMWARTFVWWLHYFSNGEILDIVRAQLREAKFLVAREADAEARRSGC